MLINFLTVQYTNLDKILAGFYDVMKIGCPQGEGKSIDGKHEFSR